MPPILSILTSDAERASVMIDGRIVGKPGLFEIAAFGADWRQFCRRSEALGGSGTTLPASLAGEIAAYGRLLANLLYGPGPLPFGKLRRGGLLAVRVDRATAVLPVEILPWQGRPLGLAIAVVRILDPVPRPQDGSIPFDPAGERLVLGEARPADRGDDGSELLRIGARQGWSMLSAARLTPHRVLARLQGTRFFHYTGHADPATLPLAPGQKLPGSDLARADLGRLEVAFLNACHATVFPDTDGGYDGETGLGEGLLRGGAAHVAGYAQQVDARQAASVAAPFWDAVERGRPVHEAVRRVRHVLRDRFGDGCLAAVLLQHYAATLPMPGTARMRRAALLTGAAAGLALVLFLTLDHTPETASPAHSPARTPGGASPAHSPRPAARPATPEPVAARPRPPAIAPTARPSAFQSLAAAFRAAPHPFYSAGEKERIIREIASSPMDETARMLRLESEFYPPRKTSH